MIYEELENLMSPANSDRLIAPDVYIRSIGIFHFLLIAYPKKKMK